MVVIFYLAYFVFADYRKSRENRLAQMFDEALNIDIGGREYKANNYQYA